MVIIALDADDAGAVDGGVQNFGGFEVGGDKDAGVETLLSGLGGYSVGEISGGGAADGLKFKPSRCGESYGYYAVFKRQRGKTDRVVLEIEIGDAPAFAEMLGTDEWRAADGVARNEVVL